MALLDLSLVSLSLKALLERAIVASPAWPGGQKLLVSLLPPDQLTGERTLGLYLFHAVEEATSKAQDWAQNGDTPQRYSPMGLNLHYLVTPHSAIADEDQRAIAEQRIFGLALKTLHDYPVLTDETSVGGSPVFPDSISRPMRGHGNRLRIRLQPLQFNEAMHYWTAGSKPMRLGAYYEVTATLLEPEPVTARAGRVLNFGAYVFTRGTPRLDGSRNTIDVSVPGVADPRAIALSPAEAGYGGSVTFFGADLGGAPTELLLQSARWKEPVKADAAWNVAASADEMTADVQETAAGLDVLPGVYAARAQVTRIQPAPDGGSRAFVSQSNATAFTIVPVIALPASLAIGAVGAIAGKRFDPAALSGEDIQLFIGPTRLNRVAAGPPGAGEFFVASASLIEFSLPPGIAPGSNPPVRLLVAGAEAAPAWLNVV